MSVKENSATRRLVDWLWLIPAVALVLYAGRLSSDIPIKEMNTQDDNLDAVFRYLVR